MAKTKKLKEGKMFKNAKAVDNDRLLSAFDDSSMAVPDPVIPVNIDGEAAGIIYDTCIRRAETGKIDMDQACREDFINGRGIRLTSVESFDKKGNKIYNGLQSPFFGSDYGDERAFADRYSCECGKCIGRPLEGQICPECDTEVQQYDTDLSRFGWVILDNFPIISPIFYNKLELALGSMDGGTKVIEGILKVGFAKQSEAEYDEKDRANLAKHPFIKKGMRWLSEHIGEVLTYYEGRRKSASARFEELRFDMDKIFCHSIPIYSNALRVETPGEKGEKVFKVKTNTMMSSIIKCANKVNEFSLEDADDPKLCYIIDRYLWQIQTDMASVWEEEFNTIKGKRGFIQNKVMSGRHNYSARNIIIAGSGYLHANEIEVCYSTFIELFRYELCSFYAKLKSCSIKTAQLEWNKAKNHFNSDFYNIMRCIIKDKKNAPYIRLMINRNPSINFGAFLYCKIVRVKPSVSDKTMTINTRIIKTLNADFDGDVLNIFRIPGADLGNKFAKNMDPTYNLYINRINGRVNPNMMPLKDEVIIFWAFNNM